MHYLFGNKVKEDGILDSIRTSEGGIIDGTIITTLEFYILMDDCVIVRHFGTDLFEYAHICDEDVICQDI